MSEQLDIIDVDIDNFESFIERFNDIVILVNTEVVTVNTTLGVTVGNGFVEGSLGANVIVATELRGGDANTPATLVISSNATFAVQMGVGANVVINTTSMAVGSNVLIDTSHVVIGNSSVNVVANSSSLIIGGNVAINTSSYFVGNSTVNTFIDKAGLNVSNSTVTYQYSMPTALQKANTIFFLNANGSWATVGIAPGGANTAVQFNDSTVFGGSAAYTFNKDSNTLILSNTSTFQVGNATVNTIINSTSITLANSTVQFVISSPTTVENAPSFFLAGDGTWVQVSFDNPIVGANTQIQFNDSDEFGASAGLTFNKDSNTLLVGNTLVLGIVTETSISTTTTGTSAQTLDSFAVASFRAAKYVVSVKDTIANGYQSSEILILQDGGNAYITEYAVLQSNGSLGVFTADISTGNARLQFTPVTTGSTVKISKILIPV